MPGSRPAALKSRSVVPLRKAAWRPKRSYSSRERASAYAGSAREPAGRPLVSDRETLPAAMLGKA